MNQVRRDGIDPAAGDLALCHHQVGGNNFHVADPQAGGAITIEEFAGRARLSEPPHSARIHSLSRAASFVIISGSWKV
jgi:hypothetical protein